MDTGEQLRRARERDQRWRDWAQRRATWRRDVAGSALIVLAVLGLAALYFVMALNAPNWAVVLLGCLGSALLSRLVAPGFIRFRTGGPAKRYRALEQERRLLLEEEREDRQRALKTAPPSLG